MRLLDRLLGTDQRETSRLSHEARTLAARRDEDGIAVKRYRHLLRTAPPATIEQVHRAAFSELTDEQRATIYEELSRGAQTGERPLSSEPATLARSATRAEFRRPGTMERILGGAGAERGGPEYATVEGGSLLGTVAGYVIGSALVSAFLAWDGRDADRGAADLGGSGDRAV